MTRIVKLGAAQLGPIQRSDSRESVVKRLLELLREAHGMGCDVVVFPELTLTTFFPRWYMEDQAEIDSFYEHEMPGPVTRPLFEEAAKLGIGFYLGYAELTVEEGRTRRFNTSILVDKTGKIVGKYRKIHLPGHAEHEPWRRFQHLEKRYFETGNLGFNVTRAFDGILGMCICNDRRWPETYRVMGLQGVEMIMLGYNTPVHNPPAPVHDNLSHFHNQLVMQSGAYQNGTWVIGVAKAYTTRVGEGPFPTELQDQTGERIREKGGEYGATTGRPRRCGWFDAVIVNHAVRINGIRGMAITKMDVLNGFDRIKICVGYRVNGKVLQQVPANPETLKKAEPLYEEMEGWKTELNEARTFNDLPEHARRYIRRIEELIGAKVMMISIGSERDETVEARNPFLEISEKTGNL